MNSFNKTEAAVFSCRLCFLWVFIFISLKLYNIYYKVSYLLTKADIDLKDSTLNIADYLNAADKSQNCVFIKKIHRK